jgi:hypothetical protein
MEKPQEQPDLRLSSLAEIPKRDPFSKTTHISRMPVVVLNMHGPGQDFIETVRLFYAGTTWESLERLRKKSGEPWEKSEKT